MQAQFLLEEGATIQDIDSVYEDFGMPMGVFKVSDLAGKIYLSPRYLYSEYYSLSSPATSNSSDKTKRGF